MPPAERLTFATAPWRCCEGASTDRYSWAASSRRGLTAGHHRQQRSAHGRPRAPARCIAFARCTAGLALQHVLSAALPLRLHATALAFKVPRFLALALRHAAVVSSVLFKRLHGRPDRRVRRHTSQFGGRCWRAKAVFVWVSTECQPLNVYPPAAQGY